jgi:DNA polymerase III subunit beta
MQFNIEKKDFTDAVNNVAKAVSAKTLQPVLSNILIETRSNESLKLLATDLDMSIEMTVKAIIKKEGSITLPARKLAEILSKFPDKMVIVKVNPETNTAEITCEKSKYELIGINATEFPKINMPEKEDGTELNLADFLKGIRQTVFAAASYDSNNVLSGVYMNLSETLEMASTDGNRLTRSITELSAKPAKTYNAIIPSRTLLEFSKLAYGSTDATVSILIQDSQLKLKLSDRYIVSRLIEGQFPKYNQLIPSNYEIKANINRDSFLNTVEKASVMVSDKNNIVKLVFKKNTLSIEADNPLYGDYFDTIEVDYTNDELKISFNNKYLMEAVKAIESENLLLEMAGPLSAAIFKPDSKDNYICLIMPVQIK